MIQGEHIKNRIGGVVIIRDVIMRFVLLLGGVECRVMSSTSWRPRIAEAVFIRGRTVQCRGECLEQLAVAAATSGRAGPTWTRGTESIRFMAKVDHFKRVKRGTHTAWHLIKFQFFIFNSISFLLNSGISVRFFHFVFRLLSF